MIRNVSERHGACGSHALSTQRQRAQELDVRLILLSSPFCSLSQSALSRRLLNKLSVSNDAEETPGTPL